MTAIQLKWSPFVSASRLPKQFESLQIFGVYIWKLSLPENKTFAVSYYVGSAAKRRLDIRLWEHIRDTMSFLYFIRDRSGDWIPKKELLEIDQFWDRLSNIENNMNVILEYMKRWSVSWASVEPKSALEAEASIYLRLESLKDSVLLDNARIPIAQHNIRHAFRNSGASEVVALLGESLDFRKPAAPA